MAVEKRNDKSQMFHSFSQLYKHATFSQRSCSSNIKTLYALSQKKPPKQTAFALQKNRNADQKKTKKPARRTSSNLCSLICDNCENNIVQDCIQQAASLALAAVPWFEAILVCYDFFFFFFSGRIKLLCELRFFSSFVLFFSTAPSRTVAVFFFPSHDSITILFNGKTKLSGHGCREKR